MKSRRNQESVTCNLENSALFRFLLSASSCMRPSSSSDKCRSQRKTHPEAHAQQGLCPYPPTRELAIGTLLLLTSSQPTSFLRQLQISH